MSMRFHKLFAGCGPFFVVWNVAQCWPFAYALFLFGIANLCEKQFALGFVQKQLVTVGVQIGWT